MTQSVDPLSAYPFKAFEKLRYGDTDRQGHVNNAVFTTILETGRVELLCSDGKLLHDEGCAIVIANLNLDYRGEINWPGRVEIGTRVAAVGRSSLSLEQGVFQEGQCVATAKTVIVQMNETTRRSQAFSDAMRSILTEFLKQQP